MNDSSLAGTMARPELKRLLAAHGIKLTTATAAALDLHLVRGKSAYAASAEAGISHSAVSRALKTIARPLCPHCGQPMGER